MKITDLELISVAGPPLPASMHPAWVPGLTLTRRGAIILKIHTDEGIVGLGCPGYSVPAVFESWIKPRLIGKATGQPLYKLWGGYADRVPAYASFVEVRSPEQRALQTARELERLGVYWLEEPLDRYNLEGLTRLCAAVDILIAGGENNRGLHEFRWLVEQNCYDVIQPEALTSEGIGQLRKVAALAELHQKLVASHHGGGGIGVAAHLHLCAAIPNASYLELWHDPPCMTGDVFQWYLREPLHIDAEGMIAVPQKPGLGVELDEEKIEKYR